MMRNSLEAGPAFRIVAIPDAVAEIVRTTGRAPRYGHPAHTELATGHGPCRQCLRSFAIGEERRILFTYDPFAGLEPLPLPGPVFIHEAACLRYREDAGFPEDLRVHPLTLNAYGRGRVLRAQEYVTDGRVEGVLGWLLDRPGVDYIHVRDTEAGCFDLQVERASGAAAPGWQPAG
jgi:hypothetical protein